MAFILDSEEEFDNDEQLAETPETDIDMRYEDLRTRFFTRRPMKYEELEELFAAAEKRGDEDVTRALRTIVTENAGSGESDAGDDSLDAALQDLAGGLNADEAEWDAYAGKLILTYKEKGWYEGPGGGWCEDWKSEWSGDAEADLVKISDRIETYGFGIVFDRNDLRKAFDDSAGETLRDREHAVNRKSNRYGDWDYTADCRMYVPLRIVKGPSKALDEADPEDECERILPDSLVYETLETLRRMY